MNTLPYLHVHSYYSFLEGLASPEALVKKASSYNIGSLAITDTHNLTGAVEFYESCNTGGLKPIFGIEVQVSFPETLLDAQKGTSSFRSLKPQEGNNNPASSLSSLTGNLVLLAMNDTGWSGLCHLASAVQFPQALSFEALSMNNQGLICLTGGLRSILQTLVRHNAKNLAEACLVEISNIFPQRTYLELQICSQDDFSECLSLASIAQRIKIPLVATHPVYYLEKEQEHLQRLVSAIRLNQRVDSLSQAFHAPPNACFIPPEEVMVRFKSFPNALQNAHEVAERCQGKPPVGITHYPIYDDASGIDTVSRLRQETYQGAISLYVAANQGGNLPASIQTRLEHELAIIIERGYAPIFLVMQEIIAFAHDSGIPTASRGSASSSLVAHCLGITTPDPIRHNLYFERFLNPARKTPPDIDTDICSLRRNEVIDFVVKRFGADRVAMVATISRLRDRSALRETAKAHGLSSERISALTEALPWRWFGPRQKDDQEDPFKIVQSRFPEPIYRQVIQDAAALVGIPDHLSVHPGGVVIAPGAMEDLVPTLPAPKGIRITHFDLDSIEKVGLVKLDLLGIRGLTVLGEVAGKLAGSRQTDKKPLDILDEIPEDDHATSETICHARTIGCFQIESPGMRATLREIRARSVDDILVALALYRPGPLTGGLKDAFVRRHLGEEAPQQLHPALTPLLADTYGVILYQEQVLRIAHELAGLSLTDSDLLRRAMSHFDPGKEMQNIRERFITGAYQVSAIPEETASRIWNLMAAFAGYGFPKAHAASYAVVSWRAAWCKTHYPALFMAAVLAGGGGYYRQRTYLNESRRLKLKLRPPHVNHAWYAFSMAYLENEPVLFMGLDQVKELTRRTQQRILDHRPFHSLQDFLARVDPRPVEVENLARCGALEGFGTIPDILGELKHGWSKGQLPLFPPTEDHREDWTIEQKVAAQEEILGTGLVAHPLELVADKISGSISTLDALRHTGDKVLVAGLMQAIRRGVSFQGNPIHKLILEDLEGTLEILIPNQIYQRNRHILTSTNPFMVEGRIDFYPDQEEPIMYAERIIPV
jgi:DNA polymerase III subunit alpha